MTRQQQFKFLQDITLVPNVKKYHDFLGGRTVPAQFSRQVFVFCFSDASACTGTLNLESSTCSRAADRQNIHQGISDTIGFAKLTRMVFGVLEDWMERELRHHISVAASTMKENHLLWLHLSNNLSLLLSQQGRDADASLIQEDVLKYLKQNWSGISGAHPTLNDMKRVCMQNLASYYGKTGRYADALAVQDELVKMSHQSLQERDRSETKRARVRACYA